MIHKAWRSIEEVPYCLSRSSVKFKSHTGSKIADFDTNWAFPDCSSSLNWLMVTEWCTRLEVAWKICPVVLQGYPSNFKVTRDKKGRFSPELSVSGLPRLFELTNDHEMMCKAWSSTEKVPHCFQGHPSNFKVTWDQKLPNCTQIEHFRTVTPVWNHWWLWNNGQSLT